MPVSAKPLSALFVLCVTRVFVQWHSRAISLEPWSIGAGFAQRNFEHGCKLFEVTIAF